MKTAITNIAENPDWIDKQALSENDVPISEGSEKPRQRKDHLARERAHLGRKGTHLPSPTADPLWQSADLFKPTEGLVRLTETLRPTDTILEVNKMSSQANVFQALFIQPEGLSDRLNVLLCQQRVPQVVLCQFRPQRWSCQTGIQLL